MSTSISDPQSALSIRAAKPPAVVSASFEGDSVDLGDADGVCLGLLCVAGLSEGGTVQGYFEESNNGEDWFSIAEGAFEAISEAPATVAIRFRRTRRYVRFTASLTGTEVECILCAVAVSQRKTF